MKKVQCVTYLEFSALDPAAKIFCHLLALYHGSISL